MSYYILNLYSNANNVELPRFHVLLSINIFFCEMVCLNLYPFLSRTHLAFHHEAVRVLYILDTHYQIIANIFSWSVACLHFLNHVF